MGRGTRPPVPIRKAFPSTPASRRGPKLRAAKRQTKVATTVLVTLKPQADAVLEIDTDAGKAAIGLKDISFDQPTKYLDGALAVRRLPSATPLAVSDYRQ